MHSVRGRRGRLALTCLTLLIAGGGVLAHGVDPHDGAKTHLLVNPTALTSVSVGATPTPDGSSAVAGTITVGLCVALLGSILAALTRRALTSDTSDRALIGLARLRAGPVGAAPPSHPETLHLCVQRC